MKKQRNLLLIVFSCLALAGTSQTVPFPSPGHEGLNTKKIADVKLDDDKTLNLGLWTQDRVLYNYSNIPGPGGTTFDSTANYDFFRQRFRLAIDVNIFDNGDSSKAGVYTQLEYRGGWGGSSPISSDPRGLGPVNNPYNRLQARGIRYGFVYYNPSEKFNLSAGILPLTDRLGRVLFDADWDFNVGGVTAGGKVGKGDYRLGYVRLMSYVGSGSINSIGTNSDLLLVDYDYSINEQFTAGGHFYAMTGPFEDISSEMWAGLTASYKLEKVQFNTALIYNTGEMKDAGMGGMKMNHSGTALKLEANAEFGKVKWALQGLYATGDKTDTAGVAEVKSRFATLHDITGTAGFWGYMHIFTPNGPSDVNDLGTEPGNGGAGLTTVQTKIDFPLVENKLGGQIFAGWFQANEERNKSVDMGFETGAMLAYSFTPNLKLEAGAAYAGVGKFYGKSPDGLVEVFTRIQFTW